MRKFTEEHVTSCLLQTMHAQCQHGECVLWVGVVDAALLSIACMFYCMSLICILYFIDRLILRAPA